MNPLWVIAFLLYLIAIRMGALNALSTLLGYAVLIATIMGGLAAVVFGAIWFYSQHPQNVRVLFTYTIVATIWAVWPKRVQELWKKDPAFNGSPRVVVFRVLLSVILAAGGWIIWNRLPSDNCVHKPITESELTQTLRFLPADASTAVIASAINQRPKCF